MYMPVSKMGAAWNYFFQLGKFLYMRDFYTKRLYMRACVIACPLNLRCNVAYSYVALYVYYKNYMSKG